MRILVISDTHGKNERVYDVYNKLASDCLFGSRPAPQPGSHRTPPVDMIVHCGDYYADAQEIRARLGIPVLAVKGNCDGCFDFEACSLLETECGDILITHGHMEDVGFSMQKLYYKALDSGCIGAFFGHTHRSVFVETGGVYLLNPGSLSQPRDGSGGTFALVTTSEAGLQAKIYYYEDFMLPTAGVGSTGGGADAPDNSAADNSAAGGTASAPETPVSPASPAASPVAPAVQKPKQKPKVKGGHLRSLINYSDRF